MIKTPWRKLLYKELKRLSLGEKTLDVGGSKNADYHKLFLNSDKENDITVLNIDSDYGYDLKVDLEKEWPIEAGEYDAVVGLNVLEHIYDYRNFLKESYRVLKSGGNIIIAVPFLIQVHPCPKDHWRFTEDTLYNIFEEAGFRNVNIKAIGRGPFLSMTQVGANLIPFSWIMNFLIFISYGLDKFLFFLRPKTLNNRRYVLGYLITANK